MRTIFSLQEQPEYFPHCSLLYAPLTADDASEQIEDMHRRSVWEKQPSDGKLTFGSGSIRMTGITLGRIELWDCNGPVEQWKCLEAVLL
jgi:hypothetical protein